MIYPVLTSNFTWQEVFASTTAKAKGIDNTFDINAPENASLVLGVKTAALGMERIRHVLNDSSIHVNSWWRCGALNVLISKVPNGGQHSKGEAVDFFAPKVPVCSVVCHMLKSEVDFVNYDQLIHEHTWIHVSFVPAPKIPRRQVISLLATGKYAVGITDKNGKAV